MNAVIDSTATTITQPQQGAQLPALRTDEEARFNILLRKAKGYAQSTLVPKAYQGNVANVLIAMQIANRIGADELMVMQNLHIVQGRPSWSSSFLIATVNACGRFTPMRFEVEGRDPKDKAYRVRAYAEDKASGERCIGAWITWDMVRAEGWESKAGSKWKTMPEQMFMYRAAGFWARVYAPEVSMGILTREEAEDVWGANHEAPPAATEHGSLKQLEAELTGTAPQPEPESADGEESPVTAREIRARLQLAQTLDELNDAADLIRYVKDAAERESLGVLYDERTVALSH